MGVNTNTNSNACLVDKFIGTAYDKVAYVADHLDEILAALATSESDHSGLINLGNPDQHPQAAIIGLVTELAQHATEMDGLLTMLETHESLTTIHFVDTSLDDGVEYVRKNRAWVIPTFVVPHDHDTLYDAIGAAAAVQANLDAHDHDSQYDPLGASDAVQTDVDALEARYNAHEIATNPHSITPAGIGASPDSHNHDDRYEILGMINSGSSLPSASGFPEGAYFVVTA